MPRAPPSERWILFSLFVVLSMSQTLLVGHTHGGASLVNRINVQSLDLSTPPAAPSSSAPGLQAPTPTVQAPPPSSAPPADPLAALVAPPPAAPKKN